MLRSQSHQRLSTRCALPDESFHAPLGKGTEGPNPSPHPSPVLARALSTRVPSPKCSQVKNTISGASVPSQPKQKREEIRATTDSRKEAPRSRSASQPQPTKTARSREPLSAGAPHDGRDGRCRATGPPAVLAPARGALQGGFQPAEHAALLSAGARLCGLLC